MADYEGASNIDRVDKDGHMEKIKIDKKGISISDDEECKQTRA